MRANIVEINIKSWHNITELAFSLLVFLYNLYQRGNSWSEEKNTFVSPPACFWDNRILSSGKVHIGFLQDMLPVSLEINISHCFIYSEVMYFTNVNQHPFLLTHSPPPTRPTSANLQENITLNYEQTITLNYKRNNKNLSA